MFTKSIRWRLLFWLMLMLACILAGFGVTAYQLNRLNRLNQLDEELKRRVATLSADFRGRAGRGLSDRGPFEKNRRESPVGREFPRDGDRPPFDKDHEGPPPFDRPGLGPGDD